jgi:thiol:disulfide interchange protein
MGCTFLPAVCRTSVAVAATGLTVVLAWSGMPTNAGEKQDSQVKLSAIASTLGADGKQTITIKMAINEGWYAYANPVQWDELETAQTVVKVEGANKLQKVTVNYPKGNEKTENGHRYYTYKGTLEIKADIERAAGDKGPLQVTVRYQTCNVSGFCLRPESVKLDVK